MHFTAHHFARCARIALACLSMLACDARAPSAPTRASKPPAPQTQVMPVAAPVLEDGLQPIDGPELIAHIRASGRKATLVNVWASWCGSCKRELPMLIDLAKALEVEGVGLVLVSVDKPDQRAAAAALLKTFVPQPASFINKGLLGPFKRALNPGWKGALPATALYDKNAELLWFWPGPVLEHEITNILSAYLEGRELEGPTLVEPDPPP